MMLPSQGCSSAWTSPQLGLISGANSHRFLRVLTRQGCPRQFSSKVRRLSASLASSILQLKKSQRSSLLRSVPISSRVSPSEKESFLPRSDQSPVNIFRRLSSSSYLGEMQLPFECQTTCCTPTGSPGQENRFTSRCQGPRVRILSGWIFPILRSLTQKSRVVRASEQSMRHSSGAEQLLSALALSRMSFFKVLLKFSYYRPTVRLSEQYLSFLISQRTGRYRFSFFSSLAILRPFSHFATSISSGTRTSVWRRSSLPTRLLRTGPNFGCLISWALEASFPIIDQSRMEGETQEIRLLIENRFAKSKLVKYKFPKRAKESNCSSHSSRDRELKHLVGLRVYNLEEQNRKEGKQPVKLKVRANNKGYSLYIKTEGDQPDFIGIFKHKNQDKKRQEKSEGRIPKTKPLKTAAKANSVIGTNTNSKEKALNVSASKPDRGGGAAKSSTKRQFGVNSSMSLSKALKKHDKKQNKQAVSRQTRSKFRLERG